jgi:hypothetical protein
VTRPMAAALVVIALGSAYGIFTVQGASQPGSDAMVELLAATSGREIRLVGRPDQVLDASGDEIGTPRPDIDIVGAEYAFLDEVPSWILGDVFDCGKPDVACAYGGVLDSMFDGGALLMVERLAAPPTTIVQGFTEWAAVLTFRGIDTAPAGIDRFAGATDIVLTQRTAGGDLIRLEEFVGGYWTDYRVAVRSRWMGSNLFTLVPISVRQRSALVRWDAYAGSGPPGTSTPTSSDTVRTGDGLLHAIAGYPPKLRFPGAASSEAP